MVEVAAFEEHRFISWELGHADDYPSTPAIAPEP